MDDNVDRKTKENDKIYKIIFEKKNSIKCIFKFYY